MKSRDLKPYRWWTHRFLWGHLFVVLHGEVLPKRLLARVAGTCRGHRRVWCPQSSWVVRSRCVWGVGNQLLVAATATKLALSLCQFEMTTTVLPVICTRLNWYIAAKSGGTNTMSSMTRTDSFSFTWNVEWISQFSANVSIRFCQYKKGLNLFAIYSRFSTFWKCIANLHPRNFHYPCLHSSQPKGSSTAIDIIILTINPSSNGQYSRRFDSPVHLSRLSSQHSRSLSNGRMGAEA